MKRLCFLNKNLQICLTKKYYDGKPLCCGWVMDVCLHLPYTLLTLDQYPALPGRILLKEVFPNRKSWSYSTMTDGFPKPKINSNVAKPQTYILLL